MSDVEGAERDAAIEGLGKVWARIGFTPHRDGVWVVDLGRVDLYDGVAALRERFGVTGW